MKTETTKKNAKIINTIGQSIDRMEHVYENQREKKNTSPRY